MLPSHVMKLILPIPKPDEHHKVSKQKGKKRMEEGREGGREKNLSLKLTCYTKLKIRYKIKYKTLKYTTFRGKTLWYLGLGRVFTLHTKTQPYTKKN